VLLAAAKYEGKKKLTTCERKRKKQGKKHLKDRNV
jgi:hypothetical protein